MSQTKKRSQCELLETDLHLPGWNTEQRHAFFEGVKVHGLKKLKKIQRFVRTKTQEEVRIATELYKKELRKHEILNDMERELEEAGVSNHDYKAAWLNFYMASKNRLPNNLLPIAVLEAFLNNSKQLFHLPPQELSFPNWRSSEIKDFLATIELAKIITDISSHIPTKTQLEIMAATDAYTIICEARNNAYKHGGILPTYDELKPGYLYLKCFVAALNGNEKLKNLKIAPNADRDMAQAEFVLKKWLMPDVGTLPQGWTKDEKYALIVAIEFYGKYDILKIQSRFPKKTEGELKEAISAYEKEVKCKDAEVKKSISARYVSLTSWGNTLTLCKENKHRILAGKRLICALEELPEPKTKICFLNLFVRKMSNDEMTKTMLNVWMQENNRKGKLLIPALHMFVRESQAALRKELRQNLQKT